MKKTVVSLVLVWLIIAFATVLSATPVAYAAGRPSTDNVVLVTAALNGDDESASCAGPAAGSCAPKGFLALAGGALVPLLAAARKGAPDSPVADDTPDIRYNLRLPGKLYAELGRIADEYGTTRLEVIRKFIQVGLFAERVQADPTQALLVRRGEDLVELQLFLPTH